MSKTKKHPCGNCIAFGDKICMQNYLECDYADVEEKKVNKRDLIIVWDRRYKENLEEMIRDLEEATECCDFSYRCTELGYDCSQCVFSWRNNPKEISCNTKGNLLDYSFKKVTRKENLAYLRQTLIDLGKTDEEIEEEKKMENKLKVGDKVVYVGKTDIVDGYTIINKCVYFVSGIASGVHIRLNGFGDSEFHVSHFELYKEPKFHSQHYESDSIEPIEFMMSNKMDFCRASIIKYAFRAGKKEGQESLDIKKIIDYAILLAIQEGIGFTKEDAQSIIDYRFSWKEERK